MFLAGEGFWVLLGWKFLTPETKTGLGSQGLQTADACYEKQGEAQLETLVFFLLQKPAHSLCLCKSDLQ